MRQAEEHVRALEGIEDVAIVWNGRVISEIHVVSSNPRPPRLISRDVESVLKARGIKVHFKTISVAQVKPLVAERMNGSGAGADAADEPELFSPRTNGADSSNGSRAHSGPVAGSLPMPQLLRIEPDEPGSRLRFVSVNLMTVGLRAQAQVELSCGSSQVMGAASGSNTRLGAARLVVAAALDAVKQLLTEDVELALEALDFVELGGRKLAVVAVAWLEERTERLLYGTAAVEAEPNQALVSATLDALNRPFGRFRAKEKVEFELRPTSLEV